ncbi:MFS transporter [Streptomyces sp. NPDC006529]|uniref:MFS transporter n=1 Tax=Streptomyces sp. NPDC006529 TaxID=3157177 RepID=UPI0033AE93F6
MTASPCAPAPAPAAASPSAPSGPPPAPMDRSPWRCLRYRSMRWWSAAGLVSNAGTWMQLTVQNLLVLQITGSAAATGLSVSVQAAPGLLFGLVGGAAVDRWPRKLTAAASQAVLGAVALVTAALVALDLLSLPVLMALAAVTGLIATVDGPACALLGNDLVRSEDVPSAIGVGSLVHSAGRLAGAALAAVAVGVMGTASAYLANGLSFFFVACVVPFLKPVRSAQPQAVAPPAPDPGEGFSARQGLAYFMGRPRLVALAAMNAVSATFGRNYSLTLVVLVAGPLAGDAGSYGKVSSVLAVGGLLGAVLGARLRHPGVRLVGALTAAGGLLQALAGVSPSVVALMVLVLPMAVAESVADTAQSTVLQTDPPARMRGRVLGAWSSIRTVWSLAAPPALGLMIELAGVRATLVAGGLVVAASIAFGYLLRGRRSRPPQPRLVGLRLAEVPA